VDSVTFVIPCYNDEATVTLVIKKSLAVAKKLHIQPTILVINDASTDQSGRVLSAFAKKYHNIRVITHTNNAGYGATIKELYLAARTEWIFSVPGDYQIDPTELTKLWKERNTADMIIGWRKNRNDNAARQRQSNMYNILIRLLFWARIHDVNSVRLMKSSMFKKISLSSTSAFVDAELCIQSKRAGFRIQEVPIVHRARAGAGASGGKLSTIIPTIRDMILFWTHTI